MTPDWAQIIVTVAFGVLSLLFSFLTLLVNKRQCQETRLHRLGMYSCFRSRSLRVVLTIARVDCQRADRTFQSLLDNSLSNDATSARLRRNSFLPPEGASQSPVDPLVPRSSLSLSFDTPPPPRSSERLHAGSDQSTKPPLESSENSG